MRDCANVVRPYVIAEVFLIDVAWLISFGAAAAIVVWRMTGMKGRTW